ncbi:MAG: sugar phosphate isomerase/epimerase [Clostridia bacterium]|nr:sugar phosphate isomerase/epimerase [Clostridia bacterium]
MNNREIAVVVSNANQNVTAIDTINAIKKAGFKNVFIQWYNKEWNPTQEVQLKYIREKGLNVIFAHLGYKNINDLWLENEVGDKLVEGYKNDIKICKENNIPMVVMHLTSKSEAPKYNETGLKRLKEIVDYAQELNIKVAFENTKIKGYLDYVIENIDNENVGICFDSGHYHVHFNDDLDFPKFKDRIFAVHLHDNDQSDDLHLMPFEGTLDWEETIKNLKECNYDGPVTLELCYRNEYLDMSIEDFYKKGYEVGEKLKEIFERE